VPDTGSREGCFTLEGVAVRLGGVPVLTGIDLTVTRGESVALIGPSGAGKTTLLRLLTGAVRPQGGRVLLGGRNLNDAAGADLRRLRAGIGFIHQDLRLVPNLRASQNVLSGQFGRLSFLASLRLFLRPPQTDLVRVHRLLERVGIAEKMFERTDRLSGGQAQRVAIARALYQQPQLLLADEPVASIDPARARDVLALLTGICREEGLTLCVSLHDPALVREFFPRVIGLRDGRVVLDVAGGDLTDDSIAGVYRLEDRDVL